MARNLAEVAVKWRGGPGIIFAGGPAGRRARVAGTGIAEEAESLEQFWRAHPETKPRWR